MRRTVVLAVATAAVAAFGIGLALRPVTHPRRTPELAQVRAQLASRYYRTLPSKVLSKPTVPGIIDALHDRYTTYLTPSEFRVAKRTSAGDYGGIGVTGSERRSSPSAVMSDRSARPEVGAGSGIAHSIPLR